MCMCEQGAADGAMCDGTPAIAAMAELADTDVAMAEDDGEDDDPADEGLPTVARMLNDDDVEQADALYDGPRQAAAAAAAAAGDEGLKWIFEIEAESILGNGNDRTSSVHL